LVADASYIDVYNCNITSVSNDCVRGWSSYGNTVFYDCNFYSIAGYVFADDASDTMFVSGGTCRYGATSFKGVSSSVHGSIASVSNFSNIESKAYIMPYEIAVTGTGPYYADIDPNMGNYQVLIVTSDVTIRTYATQRWLIGSIRLDILMDGSAYTVTLDPTNCSYDAGISIADPGVTTILYDSQYSLTTWRAWEL
jgi:hypothetical protein